MASALVVPRLHSCATTAARRSSKVDPAAGRIPVISSQAERPQVAVLGESCSYTLRTMLRASAPSSPVPRRWPRWGPVPQRACSRVRSLRLFNCYAPSVIVTVPNCGTCSFVSTTLLVPPLSVIAAQSTHRANSAAAPEHGCSESSPAPTARESKSCPQCCLHVCLPPYPHPSSLSSVTLAVTVMVSAATLTTVTFAPMGRSSLNMRGHSSAYRLSPPAVYPHQPKSL